MSDPWDTPPLPTRGDGSQKTTYASMGHALTTWEHLEINLACLFAVMTCGEAYDKAAIGKYGEGKAVFVIRHRALKHLGRKYFARYPDQKDEGDFEEVIARAFNFSARRNDIAHSILRSFYLLTHPGRSFLDAPKRESWCLFPAYFKDKRFKWADKPAYAYTSKELDALRAHFDSLSADIHRLWKRLESRHRALRYKPAPIKSVLSGDR
ncbi:MAG TPA: hypothetical protein VEU53_07860 [Stellaceae bacterium]|nr:hypothetical protein [Stellaceae bacterium]